MTDIETATLLDAMASFAGVVTDHPRGTTGACVGVMIASEGALWAFTLGLTSALVARGYTIAEATDLVGRLGSPEVDVTGGGLVAYWRHLRA